MKRVTANFKQSHYAQKQVGQKNQRTVISGDCALECIGNSLQRLNDFRLETKKTNNQINNYINGNNVLILRCSYNLIFK